MRLHRHSFEELIDENNLKVIRIMFTTAETFIEKCMKCNKIRWVYERKEKIDQSE